ncbi:peptidase C14 caspase catalytic subunit p20 [Halothece sp. PCC 7418]|uniref:DUF2808 domain-containing protein n=1 Tax=Halothece sp. (strain PCC 7418) TaxID=65093 RepID=UPI0002A07479|nr:DUF2808 domain-containing protein [Halothece sp. PCC 7418]AFZ45567.1 peptidase C14 caspase catalytic subunit p20 [Halothece sp. PCC 7418]
MIGSLSAFSIGHEQSLFAQTELREGSELLSHPRDRADNRRRVALVIGNADYTVGSPLQNPVNDATDITAMLQELGFDKVITVTDADLRKMESAVNNFTNELQSGSVGLFYYAGHGMQTQGENYLIPIDAEIQSESDIRYESLPLGKVLGRMEDAGNGVNIVILDACRNNPFSRGWRSSGSQGLAEVRAEGMLIAYATAPGDVASDGKGRNGTFTGALLKGMSTPGQDIVLMMRDVRRMVKQETGGKQIPWVSTSLDNNFAFVPSAPEPPELVSNNASNNSSTSPADNSEPPELAANNASNNSSTSPANNSEPPELVSNNASNNSSTSPADNSEPPELAANNASNNSSTSSDNNSEPPELAANNASNNSSTSPADNSEPPELAANNASNNSSTSPANNSEPPELVSNNASNNSSTSPANNSEPPELAANNASNNSSTSSDNTNQQPNQRATFKESPHVLRARTTRNGIGARGAKHYFTFSLPANAGQGLQAVQIKQHRSTESIRYQLEDTIAFTGENRNSGQKLAIQETSLDEETQTVTITFTEPLMPGTTFTVGLIPKKNPNSSGVYLFGLTAIPEGDKPITLNLGVVRFHFRDIDIF